jgi:hypothetical protein
MTGREPLAALFAMTLLATGSATSRAQMPSPRSPSIRWQSGLTAATEQAINERKPLVVFLIASTGEPSRKLAAVLAQGPEVNGLADQGVFLWLDVAGAAPAQAVARMLAQLKIERYPTIVVFDCRPAARTERQRIAGDLSDADLAAQLRPILAAQRPAPAPAPSRSLTGLGATRAVTGRLLQPDPETPGPGGFAPTAPAPSAPAGAPAESEFAAAERLYSRTQTIRAHALWLGYTHYTKAVSGYRLAHHWLDSGERNPDVHNGYRIAQTELASAKAALETESRDYARTSQFALTQNCNEMLVYVQKLSDRVKAELGRLNNADPAPAPAVRQ